MRVLQVLASVAASKGGPSTAVRELSRAFADLGIDVTVAAHDDGDRCNQVALEASFDQRTSVEIFRRDTGPWEYSASYRRWLRQRVHGFDFVIVHSLFLAHTYFATRAAQRAGVPYAVRPHGSLTVNDMREKRLAKRGYLRAIDMKALRGSSFIFCTSEQEAVDCQRFGLTNTAVIPLGVQDDYFERRISRTRDRFEMLFLGRLAPKKGADLVVRSLASEVGRAREFRALIVGPDDGLLRRGLKDLANSLGVQDRIQFREYVRDPEKRELLDRAGVFVLPSLDENFGVAPAEAMARGLPVMITKGVSHAAAVEQAGAGTVIDRTPDDIALEATRIATLPESEYLRMGAAARSVAATQYRWKASAASLRDRMAAS